MAWYHDNNKKMHVVTYTNEKLLQREVEEAAKFGWIPQQMAGIQGHINVGRTATAAMLTGGLSLMLGASRSKDKMTITYVRDEKWMARAKADEAVKTLYEQGGALQKLDQDLAQCTPALFRALDSATGQGLDRFEIEQEIFSTLKQLVNARTSANQIRRQMLDTIGGVRETYARANQLGAEVTRLTIDLDAEVNRLTPSIAPEAERIPLEQQLVEVQQVVLRFARDWKDGAIEVQKANARLREVNTQVEMAQAAATSAPPDQREKLAKKLRGAQEEQARMQDYVQQWQNVLAKREQSLRDVLQHRDALVARIRAMPEVAPAPTLPALPQQPLAQSRIQIAPTSMPLVSATPPSRGAISGADHPDDVLSRIAKLGELRQAGVLTDEEFAAKKAELLARL